MSIEKIIAENTSVMRELISAIYDLTNKLEAQPEVAQNTGSGDEIPGEHGPIQSPDPAVVTEPEQPAQNDVTYEQLATALTRYANKNGKAATVELLMGFELKRLTEADPSDYPAIYEALQVGV